MADKDPKTIEENEEPVSVENIEEEAAAGDAIEEAPEVLVEEPEADPVEPVSEEELKEASKEEEVTIPDFRPGDTVRVLYKIIEGKKTRIQPYEGIVISKKGSGMSKTFTVRRIGADKIGVERIFPLHSPNITKLEIKKSGKPRRAKLYYLRNKVGRAAIRIKERKPKPQAKAKTAKK